MKILFFGYRNVGAQCLKYLLKRGEHIVGAVVPPEDNGRDDWSFSVRKIALKHKLLVLNPRRLKNIYFIKRIKKIKPDIIFSCYYSRIIPKDILDIATYGAINLHGGLLPKYRGCFSGAWSIINSETESGVTMHYMREDTDTGDILAVEKVPISNKDTGFSLYKKVSMAAVSLFKEKYPDLKKYGRLKGIPQDHKQARCYDRKVPFNGKIEWRKTKREIYNFVRALYFPPFKPAFTMYKNKELLVRQVKEVNRTGQLYNREKPGEIVRIAPKSVVVKAGDGYIRLLTVESRKGKHNTSSFSDVIKDETLALREVLS